MEYRILKKIQHFSVPRWLRVLFGLSLILTGVLLSIFPFVPGFLFVIAGVVFLIPGRKLRKLVKIRKGIIHLFQNFSWEKLKHKYLDLKKHIKHIIFHK